MLEAIVSKWEGIATGWRPSLVGWLQVDKTVVENHITTKQRLKIIYHSRIND